tara:strand:+ start:96 stop:731 length:636 start_codon:yes stop_codon:yes gene_type:complete
MEKYIVKSTGHRIAYEASLSVSDGYTGLHGRDEYNAAIMHIFDLIKASYTLLMANIAAPSLFLSITIFEEIAKVHAGHMRSRRELETKQRVKRSKDPLFNHSKKHMISIDPLFLSSERLYNSIGKERVEEIIANYEIGKYSYLREKSLYFSRDNEGLHIPSKVISINLSAEHLLIAIELFNELFWGMTAAASIAGDETDELFSRVAQMLKH